MTAAETLTGPVVVRVSEEMIERGALALLRADATEPHDRRDGRWRPAVLAETVLRAALIPCGGQSADDPESHDPRR